MEQKTFEIKAILLIIFQERILAIDYNVNIFIHLLLLYILILLICFQLKLILVLRCDLDAVKQFLSLSYFFDLSSIFFSLYLICISDFGFSEVSSNVELLTIFGF